MHLAFCLQLWLWSKQHAEACWLSIIFVLASYWGLKQPCCVSASIKKEQARWWDDTLVCMYTFSHSLYMQITCKKLSFLHLVLPSHECVSDREKKPSVSSLGRISNLQPSVSKPSQASLLYLNLTFLPLNLHLELLNVLKSLHGPYCSRSLFLNLEWR